MTIAEQVGQLTKSSKFKNFETVFVGLKTAVDAAESKESLRELSDLLHRFLRLMEQKADRSPGKVTHFFRSSSDSLKQRQELLTAANATLQAADRRYAQSIETLQSYQNEIANVAGTDHTVTFAQKTQDLQAHTLQLWTIDPKLDPISSYQVDELCKVIGDEIRKNAAKRSAMGALAARIYADERLLPAVKRELLWRYPDLYLQRLGASTSGVFKIEHKGRPRVFKPIDFEPNGLFGMSLPSMLDDDEVGRLREREGRIQRCGVRAGTTGLNEVAAYQLDQILKPYFDNTALGRLPESEYISFWGLEGASLEFLDGGTPVNLDDTLPAGMSDDDVHKLAFFGFLSGQCDFWEAMTAGGKLRTLDYALAFTDEMVVFSSSSLPTELASIPNALRSTCERPVSDRFRASVAGIIIEQTARRLAELCPKLSDTSILEFCIRLLYLKIAIAGGKTLVQIEQALRRQLHEKVDTALAAIGFRKPCERTPNIREHWTRLAAQLAPQFP